MKLKDIYDMSVKPDIYTPGTNFMWSDPYISKHLLKTHLDDNTDLASRKNCTIKNTISWLNSLLGEKDNSKILDLGCGPGLYTDLLYKPSREITGIDINSASIDYAKNKSKESNTNINYINKNYLEVTLPENHYDLVIMIYTDFCVLSPAEQSLLLKKIYNSLVAGGKFIFDFYKANSYKKYLLNKSWEAVPNGFWSANEYLALFQSFHYEESKVILHQHIILEDEEPVRDFRFWIKFFSKNEMESLLSEAGFSTIKIFSNMLDTLSGQKNQGVDFCCAIK